MNIVNNATNWTESIPIAEDGLIISALCCCLINCRFSIKFVRCVAPPFHPPYVAVFFWLARWCFQARAGLYKVKWEFSATILCVLKDFCRVLHVYGIAEGTQRGREVILGNWPRLQKTPTYIVRCFMQPSPGLFRQESNGDMLLRVTQGASCHRNTPCPAPPAKWQQHRKSGDPEKRRELIHANYFYGIPLRYRGYPSY